MWPPQGKWYSSSASGTRGSAICRDVRARERLGSDGNALKRFSLEDLPRGPESLHGEILIARAGQQTGVHQGVVGGVGAVDGDVAAAEGSDEHDGDGSVVLAVEGLVGEEVMQRSGIPVWKRQFQLWPISRELGKAF